jgi:hypothetical protein
VRERLFEVLDRVARADGGGPVRRDPKGHPAKHPRGAPRVSACQRLRVVLFKEGSLMAKRRSKRAITIGRALNRSRGTRSVCRRLRLSGDDVLVVKGSLDTFIGTIKNRSFEIRLSDDEVEDVRTELIDSILFKNPAQPFGDKMNLANGGVLSGKILTDPVVMRTLGRDKRFRTATVAGIVFGG